MKLKETAAKLDAYLKAFERDPLVNTPLPGRLDLHSYYHASACQSGRYVCIRYITYQHPTNLTKAEAEQYLAWLDAGNKGKHYSMGK
jgi:hypothetical protein